MAEQYLKVNVTIPIDMAVIFMVISYSRFLYIQIIEWKLYALCIITEALLEAAMIHLHLIPVFDPVFNLHICFFTESFHIIRITLIYSVDFVTNILFVTQASSFVKQSFLISKFVILRKNVSKIFLSSVEKWWIRDKILIWQFLVTLL